MPAVNAAVHQPYLKTSNPQVLPCVELHLPNGWQQDAIFASNHRGRRVGEEPLREEVQCLVLQISLIHIPLAQTRLVAG